MQQSRDRASSLKLKVSNSVRFSSPSMSRIFVAEIRKKVFRMARPLERVRFATDMEKSVLMNNFEKRGWVQTTAEQGKSNITSVRSLFTFKKETGIFTGAQ